MSTRHGTEVRARQHQVQVRLTDLELRDLRNLAHRAGETAATTIRRLIDERTRTMSDTDECRHGMVPEFCADCRGLTLDTPDDWVIIRHLEAKFDGVCDRDQRPILPGMIIGMTDDRRYLCEGCVKELDR